jgi:hypothetical protein
MQTISDEQQQTKRRHVPPNPAGMLTVEVVFGTPGKNCEGLGMCHVKVLTSNDLQAFVPRKCQRALAYLGLAREGYWQMIVPKATLCTCVRERYFGDAMFTMDKRFRLPGTLTSYFDTTHRIIAKGKYEIEKSADYYVVCFG